MRKVDNGKRIVVNARSEITRGPFESRDSQAHGGGVAHVGGLPSWGGCVAGVAVGDVLPQVARIGESEQWREFLLKTKWITTNGCLLLGQCIGDGVVVASKPGFVLVVTGDTVVTCSNAQMVKTIHSSMRNADSQKRETTLKNEKFS